MPYRHHRHSVCLLRTLYTALFLFVLTAAGQAATLPPTSGELVALTEATVNSLTRDGAATVTLADGGEQALTVAFAGGNGYPGFTLPAPQGGWDLSAYAGVQAAVTNQGQGAVTVALRVDNTGDWKKSPWNIEQVSIAAGATKTLKVTFGRSFGGPGYALDTAKVTAVKMYAVTPKQQTTLVVKEIKAFGTAPAPPAATEPAASGSIKLFTADAATIARTRNEGAQASLVDVNGGKALKAEFTVDAYPGLYLPAEQGRWDLSAYAGIQADITNTSEGPVTAMLRVDNAGDWKKNPWNTEWMRLAPGERKTIKVTFGKSYGGQTGYALDPSKVVGVKIFVEKPKQPVTLLLTSLEPFGAAPQPAAPAAAPLVNGELLSIDDTTVARIRAEGATATLAEVNGTKVIAGAFPVDNYPGIYLPAPQGVWNLSAYAGVQIDATNGGNAPVTVALRVDNAGDWQKAPWNTESLRLAPGETKTLKVTFGKSYGGQSGYALNPAKVIGVKLFAEKPKQPATVTFAHLKPFGTAPEHPAAAAPRPENMTAPAISGELLTLTGNVNLAAFKTAQSEVALTETQGRPALKVVFGTGENLYPNVQFPIPAGGWNLSAFGGVQVEVTNPGATDVTAFLRVDNPGSWKDSPWNTEATKIPAGQTKTVRLTFGQSNGAPDFPLDPTRVVGIQLFLVRPKQPTTLLLAELKACGSPKDRTAGLTSPDDRTTTVTLPAWSGQRPPVEGAWVLTLDENFDGTAINEKVWQDKTWWNGLLTGQTQRYSKDNLVLDNGVLKIKCEKRPGPQYDDPKLPSREYTTGHLITYDRWTQLYGYFEARIKLPTARGLWPAFWMMPDRGPAAGPEGWQRESTAQGGMEIDILEHLTEWGAGRYNVAVHWDGYEATHKSWGTSNVYYGNTPDGWHTWGLLWEPGKLTWYCDGRKTAEFSNERVGTIPAYLLLNVQMGGWATKDVDEAKLPDYMQVDYVRAWQLKERMPKN